MANTQINNKSFAELHESFVKELKSKNRSESTIIAYAKDIEQLLNFLSSRGVADISKSSIEELEGFKKELERTNYTPKSISRKINSTRTFFKHLIERSIITNDPAEKLAHPKFEVKPPRVLSEMEYRSLRDVSRVDTRLYAIVELLLQSGIRISELAGLKLEDVQENEKGIKYLYIQQQGSHSSRPVPLNQAAYKALSEYLKIRPETEDDTLFITKNGRPLLVRNIRTAIDKAFEKAGVKNAKVNDLRNTFIAHHLANGVSLVTVSKLVGHKRLSTTEKYLNLVKNSKEESEKNLKEL